MKHPILDALGWATAVAGTAVLATQVLGRTDGRVVAVAQSLTPVLACAALPVALHGVARRQHALALVGAVAAGGLGAVVAPAIRGGTSLATSTGAAVPADAITVAHENMLYTNVPHARQAAAAMMATGADVLAMSELNSHHERALVELGGHERYPHRIGRAGNRSEGIALWSRRPLTAVVEQPMDRRPGIVATVQTTNGPMRIVLAHPDPPTIAMGLRHWEPSMRQIRRIADSPGPPTLVLADLNASRWHPAFRRMLTDGWGDAHEMAGRGLSVSWPCGNRWVPRFVRLDHALVGPGLELIGVDDFDVAGSDHRALLVTVRAGG
jgi:endonuclease/exonuclease/phosphatase (EEP) superfamily protein YafD